VKSFKSFAIEYGALIFLVWLIIGAFISFVRMLPGHSGDSCKEMVIDDYIVGRMFCLKEQVNGE